MARSVADKSNLALVTKSNTFIRAHVKADSKSFYHILNIVASKIGPNDKDFAVYQIPVRDILRSSPNAGVGGQRYKAAADIIDKVMSTKLYLPKADQKLNVYTLFSKIELDEENNYIAVGIHPELKPHFLDLKAHYTQMRLNDLLVISSKYSIRLFEILMSWRNMPAYVAELDELHNMLGTPLSMRKDFRQFRVRILEPAQRDIYNKTEFYFDWAPLTKGRRVDRIKFSFTEPDPLSAEEQKKIDAEKIVMLQSESNKCYEANQAKKRDCKPKKRSEVCQYCTERGRRSMHIIHTAEKQ